MSPADPDRYPDTLRHLAIELATLEPFLGHPAAPPDLEPRVIALAHRLSNELQLQILGEHAAAHRPCPAEALR